GAGRRSGAAVIGASRYRWLPPARLPLAIRGNRVMKPTPWSGNSAQNLVVRGVSGEGEAEGRGGGLGLGGRAHPQLPQRHLGLRELLVGEVLDEQRPVEVVELVLEHAGHVLVGLDLH